MKTHTTPRQPLRPLTDADRAMILALAAKHSVGLEERCARYRRRAAVLRTAAAACLLVLFSANVSNAFAAVPQYTMIDANEKIDNSFFCDTVGSMLLNSKQNVA